MRIKNIFALAFSAALFLTSCRTPYLTKVTSSENQVLIDSSVVADTSIVSYYLPFKNKLETEMNRVIGHSDQFLSKIRTQPEFLVGNFFADAVLEIGKSIDQTSQIAIATKDGIRSEIKQGPITVGNIFELMPFENTITILEIKGSDLFELTQFIAQTGGQPIAGFTMEIENNEPKNILIQGEKLDLNKTYKLVTYDYLANGGDYIKGILKPLNRINTAFTVRDQIINYVEKLTKSGKSVNIKLDGRIKIHK